MRKDLRVEHDTDRHRFVAQLPEGDAVVVYRDEGGGTLDLLHTEVPAAVEGSGVASALVHGVVAHARAENLRLRATCPYVKTWLRRHAAEGDVFVS